MQPNKPHNLPLFTVPKFPSTRYQGSKSKLIDWIWNTLAPLDFYTALDAFGGTGIVAYKMKQAGKAVTYNDLLRFNHHFGRALIENTSVTLSADDIAAALNHTANDVYPDVITRNFHDIYFTDAENAWLDRTVTKNITFPYQDYSAHFMCGVIYSRSEVREDALSLARLDELDAIVPVITNLTFMFQERWQIASDAIGSHNTRNIGSVKEIQRLQGGNGTFAAHGEAIFNDYWRHYMTKSMAEAIDSVVPFRNLAEYSAWRTPPT